MEFEVFGTTRQSDRTQDFKFDFRCHNQVDIRCVIIIYQFYFTVIKVEIGFLTRSCDQAGSTSGSGLLQLEKLVVLGGLT